MKRSLVAIIAAAILVIAAAAVVYYISTENRKAAEEDEFLPFGNQVAVQDLKDAKLTIYIEGQSDTALAKVLAAVNEKLRDELKAELSFEFIGAEPEPYLDNIRSTIAAGSPCDAFYYSSYFPSTLASLAKEGLIKDLSGSFQQYAPDYFSKFSTNELAAMSSNGRIYAIPARIPSADRRCAIVRQDLMKKYNIPEIDSYPDFEVYLETIKKNEPDMIPLNYWDTTLGLFSGVNGYVTLDYGLGLVYKWDSPSIKLEAWEQTSGFTEGMNRIKNWYDKGYLLKNVGIAQIDENMITSGKWASFISNLGDEFQFNTLLALEGISDYKYRAYQLSAGYSARNSPLESGLLVSEKSLQADRLLMFVNWLQSSQKNYDLLMYGIKGVHYKEESDYITPVVATDAEHSFFSWSWKVPFRNIDYERANFSGVKEEIVRYTKIINERTKYPPHLGFSPDYSAVSELVNLRRTSVNELDRKVYSGAFTANDTEVFVKEQKENGVDNIVLELQRQIDEYGAGK